MVHVPTYYSGAFDPRRFKFIVRVLTKKLNEMVKEDPEIKAIAACGQSGIPVAAAVAYETGLSLTTVRKEGEPVTHAGKFVTGYIGQGKYVIIDDLVDSGKTIRHITKSIQKVRDDFGYTYETLTPKAVVVYHSYTDNVVPDTALPIIGVVNEVALAANQQPLPSPQFRILEAYARARNPIPPSPYYRR